MKENEFADNMNTQCLKPRFKTLSECDHTKEKNNHYNEILFNRVHFKLKSNHEVCHELENCHVIRNYPILREYTSVEIVHPEEGNKRYDYFKSLYKYGMPKVDMV